MSIPLICSRQNFNLCYNYYKLSKIRLTSTKNMMNKDIYIASINSTGQKGAPRYNRLRIPEDTKELILEYRHNEIIIKHQSEEAIINLNNRLFSKYGESDHHKFKEWSGNKHSKVVLNLLDLNRGIIEIFEIN